MDSSTTPPSGHTWPSDGEHLFTEWMALTGPPKAKQYRKCVHPKCHHFEEREAPKG